MARHAERFGREALPRFSDDDVVQWLVEEALMQKLDRHEHDLEMSASRDREVSAAQQRVRARLDEDRRSR